MMIRIAGLYERTSEKTGGKYLTGRLNVGARVLVLQNLKATATDAPPWEMFIAEAPNTLTPERVEAWKAQHPVDKPELLLHRAGDSAPPAPAPRRRRRPPYPKAKAQDPDQGAGPAEDFNDPLPPELMP